MRPEHRQFRRDAAHKRGHKQAVAKAPMRGERSRRCSFSNADLQERNRSCDPMCGSGTFVIEAAEIALGLMPGRTRAFAFGAAAVPFKQENWED